MNCHSNLSKTPSNHAKTLIRNLHYLFITTRIKPRRLSFLPHFGHSPHIQLFAHYFPTVVTAPSYTIHPPGAVPPALPGLVSVFDFQVRPSCLCKTSSQKGCDLHRALGISDALCHSLALPFFQFLELLCFLSIIISPNLSAPVSNNYVPYGMFGIRDLMTKRNH